MNRRGSIAIGPGAPSLVLVAVVLSLSVLGMLALMGARNDLRLAERSAEVTASVYALNGRAERALAELDEGVLQALAGGEDPLAALPEEMEADEAGVSFALTDGLRTLELTASLPGEPREHAAWQRHRLVVETEEEEWN